MATLVRQYERKHKKGFAAICGEPRGGLPLAVALSHKLDLRVCEFMASDVIWVDDIYDRGKAFADHWQLKDNITLGVVWCVRDGHMTLPPNLRAAEIVEPKRWVVFPWEDPKRAEESRIAYEAAKASSPVKDEDAFYHD